MRDLDTLLSERSHTPKRGLPANFTDTIIAELKARPYQPKKESLYMKFMKRPIAVALAVLLVLSAATGTTYAATDGFKKPFDLRNIFGYQELTLSDGGKVISIKTSKCSDVAYVTNDSQPASDGHLYLKQKANSTLSTHDVLEYVQGYCEQTQASQWLQQKFMDMHNAYPESDDYSLVAEDGPVVSHTADTLTINTVTLDSDGKAVDVLYGYSASTQFTAYQNQSLTAEDIVTGRSAFTIGLQRGASNQLLYVYQRSAAETMYATNATAELHNPGSNIFAGQIERVAPCTQDASGFCDWEDPTRDFTSGVQTPEQKKVAAHIVAIFTAYNSNVTEDAMITFKQYVTPELAKALDQPRGFDLITCSQGQTESISFTPASISDGIMTMTMFGKWDDGAAPHSMGEITYDLAKQKVSNITCSAGLGL